MAALKVPEPDRSVIAATGEPAAIGTHLEGLHRPLVSLLLPHTLATLHLPPAQSAIAAATEQPLSARLPGHGRGFAGMRPQSSDTRSTLHIPHQQLRTACTGQPGALGTEGYAVDGPLMPLHLVEHRPTSGVPNLNLTTISPADQPRATRAPGQPTDPDQQPSPDH